MAGKKGTSSKRELIDTGTDKRYVRRDEQGQFKESDDVSRSLSNNRREGRPPVDNCRREASGRYSIERGERGGLDGLRQNRVEQGQQRFGCLSFRGKSKQADCFEPC